MSGVKFTSEHEWIRIDGEIGTVGITDYAQDHLGDIVYVELPEPGKTVAMHDETAVVESVKAASEVYAPVGGEVTEVNEALAEKPDLVNQSPMDEGWFFRLRVGDAAELDELMDEAAYKAFVAGLE